MQDVTFFSAALQRNMPYRVVLPANYDADGKKLPVVYLLHGGGETFRNWTNDSDVAQYAAHGLILVMPQGDSSYYVNSARNPQGRYEDYVVKDLITDVEQRFPAARDRRHRAIMGVSMGGFGAVVLTLKHPELFGFAAGISPALDVPSRPFSVRRIPQWRHHRSIFGDWDGQHQRDNDPYVLARSADPAKTPYLWLSCGDHEGLLPANLRFARILKERGFRFQFTREHGGHNWSQWNPLLPILFSALNAETQMTPGSNPPSILPLHESRSRYTLSHIGF
ncbi:MAG: alpha/beta hydrolase [Actinomycetota bacterium]